MPMFESQRTLRGHAFYPGVRVLKALVPRTPRREPDQSPCIVFHSPWGHIVVTEIDPQTLNGYGWTCLSGFPLGAEWGDLGYLGEIEKRRGLPFEYWERDLHSRDANAAAAIARILTRYAPPARPERDAAPASEAAPAVPAAPVHALVPRTPRGALSRR
ncbi:hypothetical protein ACWGH2_41880 [Streptomyces sp. NPDC054871]